jgi:hypothetical protein
MCKGNRLLQSTMSSSAQDLLPNIDLANMFGAFFLGVIIAALLVTSLICILCGQS